MPEQTLATQRALVAQYEGTITNDQGTLDAARLNVTYSHITAPITGVVGLRLVDPRNIVHAADTTGMLVITQIQPISVIFTVGEDQLATIPAEDTRRSDAARGGVGPRAEEQTRDRLT